VRVLIVVNGFFWNFYGPSFMASLMTESQKVN
jgi:hypothetical protein